jgi:hypothetical protein
MTKKVDRGDWLAGFSPLPSSLHPTFFVLNKLLKNSFKVKRELEGGATNREESNSIFDDFFETTGPGASSTSQKASSTAVLQQDFDRLFKNSKYYYLHIGDPVLSLCNVVDYKAFREDLTGLTKLLTKLYIDQIIYECVQRGDWLDNFPTLLQRVQDLVSYESISQVLDFDHAKIYIEDELTKLKNPKFLVSWYLGLGKSKEALKVTEGLSLQVDSWSHTRSNRFLCIWSDQIILK